MVLTWSAESEDDLDLYVQAASGHIVSFNNREGGQGSLISLDHDALGKVRNNTLPNQEGVIVNHNEEVVSFRGVTEGENIVTVQDKSNPNLLMVSLEFRVDIYDPDAIETITFNFNTGG